MVRKALQALLVIATLAVVVYTFSPKEYEGSVRDPSKRTGLGSFELKEPDGRSWSMDEQRGKLVLVNFWATWCPPCRKETPALVRISREYAGELAVVGIAADDPPDAVRKFAREYDVPYPLLMSTDDFHFSRTVESLPTTFLVDRAGRVAKTYVGAVSETRLRADIDKLMTEGTS